MLLEWFNAHDAASAGVTLADSLAPSVAPRSAKDLRKQEAGALQALLQRADREVRTLRLNFYKKAKFANSFKWRLIENGVEPSIANEVTQSLLLHLAQDQSKAAKISDSASPRPDSVKIRQLVDQGNKCLSLGAYAQAVVEYQESLELQPRNPETLCNLGVALFSLGRYEEAEGCYRQSLEINPMSAETLCNLAAVSQSNLPEAEKYLRRAL